MALMTDDKKKIEETDDEPTYWCRRCMSLRVMAGCGCCDYCGDCGSCDIQKATWDHYVVALEARKRKKRLERERMRDRRGAR